MPRALLQNSKILEIHLKLSQYPILADEIRARMREELYKRGIITVTALEQEIEEKAIQSQKREGLTDPYFEETAEVWQQRTKIIKDNLTDFYFAYNLPPDLFESIVQAVVYKKAPHKKKVEVTLNPEMAPWALLLSRAEEYERLPAEERKKVEHHLQEILVVITKTLISDHLRFIGISRQYFNILDLKKIIECRVGRGKIGGKAAGMLLAYKILQTSDPEDKIDVSRHVTIPQSYYIGADVFYDFLTSNNLLNYMNQKYKPGEQIESEANQIKQAFMRGRFSEDIRRWLREILEKVGQTPVIVRSSSLLEDSFGTAFAGKYDSFFCPNQGPLEENLENLMDAIKKVYASTLNPETLLYRRHKGLLDYDERMAVLIQEVVGSGYEHYFFPPLAGVAFSHNPFRWNQKIKPKAGFLRLVWGLGTRAVDRVDRDYPRMIALSHPMLRPETTRDEIVKYSQHYIDLVDMAENTMKTLLITEVIGDDYPSIQHLVSIDKGDYLQPLIALGNEITPEHMVLTFDNLLKNTSFVTVMKTILKKLERHYQTPIDMEFAAEIIPSYPYPDFKIQILQCRPLSEHPFMGQVNYPRHVPEQDIIFTANKWITSGQVRNIEYIVYVDPEAYERLSDYPTKVEIGRAVGRINKALEGKVFILLGPGRWGSSNIDLGVKVTYRDIYNTSILGEIATARGDETPEVSYGTHFFQDLVEACIYPLPLYPGRKNTIFNYDFFKMTKNCLSSISPGDEWLSSHVKVIDIPVVSGGRVMEVVMDGDSEQAIGYLKYPEEGGDEGEDDY